MSRSASNKCPHLDNVVQLSLLELCKLKKGEPCTECDANGPNLWICLQKNCLHIGCSEQYNDHSTTHFQTYRSHCIHMNLSSQRIWCYLCEFEVFLAQQHHQQIRRTSVVSNDSSDTSRYSANNEKLLMYGDRFTAGSGGGESCDSSCEEDEFERHGKWNGLVGLQNIANTCYMNAAIQALSNSPPLTGFFLDCGSILETDLLGNQTVSKPGLAKHYHKLIKEMWCKNRRYIVPSGILYGIRIVHPMFRGYQQHDTQEFLRCFMDQLHEELKEIAHPPPELLPQQDNRIVKTSDINHSPCSSPSPSQSEAEYETCDSGVSEQSSLSDEISVNSKRTKRVSRSPSPNASQRNLSSGSRQQSPIGSNRSTSSSTGSMTSSHQQQQPGNAGDQQQPKTIKDKLSERSIISDIFDGKLLSSVQCLTCDRISTREETFQDLSLPIPGKDHLAVLHQTHSGMSTTSHTTSGSGGGSAGSASGNGSSGITCSDAVYPVTGDSWIWWIWNWPIWSWVRSWFWGPAVSLHDCMAAFFSADELKGDNMYSCEKCNKLRNGVKFSRVLALPEMLCVHLKRFRHDLSYSSKISSPVHFPLHGLDMRPYLHKDCKSDITSYDLCAVICHHGTVGGGHYTSFAKHDPTGKWFEFDDQLVTQVNPDDVQNCEAYVLFYRKNNTKMVTIRAQASDLINVQEHASDIRFYISRNWLHRFNTFAEPGPIDNWTLLCPHGAFPPSKAPYFSKLVVPIPQALWDFLYQKFGGGPVCNHIFPCHTCKKAAESLSRRQRAELEAFTACHDEYQYNENPTPIYAISMAWFRQWQLFARGVTTDEPGPVDNKSVAVPGDTSIPLRSVRQGSDYAQINSTLWHFFHGIYGGGPEIVLRGQPVPPPELKPTKSVKERDAEPMEIGEPLQPSSQSSTISNGGLEAPCEVSAEAPSSAVNQTVSQKPQKSVSFEDNEGYIDSSVGHSEMLRSVQMKRKQIKQQKEQQQSKESRKTEAESTDGLVTYLRRKQFKHQQQVSQDPGSDRHQNDLLDIRGKKDKRHRAGMKASGLFGADGKYQPTNSDNTSSGSIPRVETTNQSPNTKVNYSNLSSAVAGTAVFSKSADEGPTSYHMSANISESSCGMTVPSKSVDEIMPLLTQTCISKAPVAEDEDDERDESDGDSEVNATSKERAQHSHHRKGAHGNKNGVHISTENGQSDRSMISFGRKKIKSKYLKSKQVKAVTVDGAEHYTVTNGTQASDSEK